MNMETGWAKHLEKDKQIEEQIGEKVEIEPRKVTVLSLEITDYKYPFVKFTTNVSSGTYIRSLVEDIGEKLGVGAYMSDLCRTRVGASNITDAIGIAQTELAKLSEY